MAILTYPLNGVLYDAEDVETYLCTRTSGVFASDGHFPASVTGSREVTIGPGLAWMQNEEFHGKAIYNPENVSLTIAEADAYQTRIDRIVLRFDKLLNQTTLTVKQGTPASNPQPPAIERTELIYELGLYTVTVKNSTVSISVSDVASTMLDENVCGIMEDAVTSIPTQELYDQWYGWFSELQTDTETFENQFNSWFAEIKEEADQYMTETKNDFEVWMNGEKVSFEEWFDTVQDTLDSDTAGKLTNLVNDAQDTADEALEQLATGIVRGFMTEEYEGGSYGLQPDDADDSYAITLQRNICDCGDNDMAGKDLISDEFQTNYTYKAGDYCIYENALYRFTVDKSAGNWNWNCVVATNVGTELANKEAEIQANATSISDIYSDMGSLLTTATGDVNNLTVPEESIADFSITVSTPSGYTPLSILYASISNGSSSGSGASFCNIYQMNRSENTVSGIVASRRTSSAVIRITVTMLFILSVSDTNALPQSIPDDGGTEIAPGPEIIDPDDETPDDNNGDDGGDDTGTLEPGEIIPDDGDDGSDDEPDDETPAPDNPEEVE